MGSKSDLGIMGDAGTFLEKMQVPFELSIMSAHRNIELVHSFAKSADVHTSVIIAGAGGAAHLAGVIAGITPIPVIGVPIKSSNSIDGWDSILSILQMPSGVPVATVALNGAKNAAILAVQILALTDTALKARFVTFKDSMKVTHNIDRTNYKEACRWT